MKGLFPMESLGAQVWLTDSFKSQDWFHSVGQDQYDRVVVYVKYLSRNILETVPSNYAGKQVLVHFASSLLSDSSAYVNTVNSINIPLYQPLKAASAPLEDEEVDLHEELWNLQRVCGRDNLIDIFYEVHDGKAAVTSISSEYPEVRAAMEVLYTNVGFDVLFEELDAEDD